MSIIYFYELRDETFDFISDCAYVSNLKFIQRIKINCVDCTMYIKIYDIFQASN